LNLNIQFLKFTVKGGVRVYFAFKFYTIGTPIRTGKNIEDLCRL